MRRPGVVGVAEGRSENGEPAVVVLVADESVVVDDEVAGHPVVVKVVGQIDAS